VLLCYDGSEHADGVIGQAAALLRPRRALVIDVSRRPFRHDLGEAGREVALRAGFDAVEILPAGRGPAAAVVLEEAHERGASVIVAGPRGRSAGPPPFGGLAAALVERSDIPVLVAHAGAAPARAIEPIFLCYDGSDVAGQAVATAAELLAGRTAIIASFLPAVDDGAVLRANLPWPAAAGTADRLARLDREEAGGPAEQAAEGARLAEAVGFVARAVGIPAGDVGTDEEGESWRPLLRAAAREEAACVVVGHRRPDMGPASTAQALLRHADRAVLVAPLSSRRP
jgi:nucleotide-binding universal stress UspA family protein